MKDSDRLRTLSLFLFKAANKLAAVFKAQSLFFIKDRL
ncbi:hypothetical protein BSMD_008450 [Bacillus subtilis Miyagi-4]|nr:hypothetical protein BSMD_008450 [Bacillus subtilis Miyagi-4]